MMDRACHRRPIAYLQELSEKQNSDKLAACRLLSCVLPVTKGIQN